MIRISDKAQCCGCTACVTACPKQCIVMRRDREGFDYPMANPDLCVECGLCEKICPVLNQNADCGLDSAPIATYAARNEGQLEKSSSGGLFPLLAAAFIQRGASVCGAVVDETCGVAHVEVVDMAGIERLKGSKYVQSDLYSILEDVKCLLEEGREVLFSGTPCQVAGLKAYLRKDYSNLYTVDFACHGVPSPGLWELYRKNIEKCHGDTLVNVDFRDKTSSWRHYNIRYDFRTNHSVSTLAVDDPYMALFYQDMTLRPSCYNCSFRAGKSGSDLTLSDLWNVEKAAPAMNDDRGVSGVMINTAAGERLWEMIAPLLMVEPISEAALKASNGGFSGSIEIPQRRQEFFKGMYSATDIHKWMKSFVVKKPLYIRAYRSIRKTLSTLKRRILK